ncbi:MAG: TIR domain-containing protein [Pseudomonadota bacterium]
MADVFISYKRADAGKAKALALAIQKAGLTVWWDSQLGAGDEWLRRIVEEIKVASSLVGVWTPNCVDQDGMFIESATGGHNFLRIEHERAGRKKVIGAVFDMKAIPIFYQDLQGADLTDWNLEDPNHTGVGSLIEALKMRSLNAKSKFTIGQIFTDIVLERGAAFSESDFDRIELAANSQDWSVSEAYLAILLSAVFSDGELAPEESDEIKTLVSRSRIFKCYNDQELAELNEVINRKLAKDEESLEKACNTIPRDMRLSIFARSVDISLADGDLNEAERSFLDELSIHLELDQSEVRKVIEVFYLKNRY